MLLRGLGGPFLVLAEGGCQSVCALVSTGWWVELHGAGDGAVVGKHVGCSWGLAHVMLGGKELLPVDLKGIQQP